MPDATTPPEVALIVDFLNTGDIEDGFESLTSPAALAEWLRDRELLPARQRVSGDDLRRAITLRTALRDVLRGWRSDGEPPAVAANAAAATLPLVVTFDAAGDAAMAPAGTGVTAALAALLAGVPAAVADGTWQRLKVCSAADCQWTFYDRSKNRSGRWCSMSSCGNRAKVRSFRQRHRAGEHLDATESA